MMLVLFDIDNTLVYSDGRDSHSFAAAFMSVFGGQMPSLNWHDYPHVTDFTIVQEIVRQQFARDAATHEIEALLDDYTARMHAARREAPHHYQSVPFAAETLARLQADGYRVGIASGGFRRPQEIKLAHIGIDHAHLPSGYADGCVTREEILQQALDQAAHLNPSSVVYVGDAAWDVRTTRNMNLPFVGIRRRGDHHVLHAEGAGQVLTDFSDYQAFLEALHAAEVPGLRNFSDAANRTSDED